MGYRVSALGLTWALVVCLAGCGGGGGDGDDATEGPATDATPLEGGYLVASSTGASGQALVLPDRSFWSLSGFESSGVLYIDTLTQGTVSRAAATVSASDLRQYDFGNGVVRTAGFSGSMTVSGVVSGTFSPSGASVTSLTLTPAEASDFDYHAAASLGTIVGTWNGDSLDGSSGSVTVSAGGAVTASLSGCSITGNVAPHPSGKNLYAVSVAFGPAPCILANSTASGIAIIGTAQQLVVALTSADRSAGTVFLGTR